MAKKLRYEKNTPWFWRKSQLHLSESWETSIRILTSYPNPHMVHNKHHELKLYTCINYVLLKRNETIFCDIQWGWNHGILMIQMHFDWNHDYISLNYGKHPSESSGTYSMHLSESCVRKIYCQILQVTKTVHITRLCSHKVADKVVIRTGERVTLHLSWEIIDNRSWITWPTFCLKLGFGWMNTTRD